MLETITDLGIEENILNAVEGIKKLFKNGLNIIV